MALPRLRMRRPNLIARLRYLGRMREISGVVVRHGFGYLFERRRFPRTALAET